MQCILLSFIISAGAINAQILQDTVSLKLINQGIDYVYNMQFRDAGKIYEKINAMYPGHPVVLLFRGMMIYWNNYPLLPGSPASMQFQKYMRDCIELCEKKDDHTARADYLLANLSARGFLLTFYADNNLTSEDFSVAKSTYKYLRRSFGYTSVYPDFLFFTGLYNYYREVYPKIHPLYMPLALLFPRGNREKGLEEIATAARYSILLRGEANYFLSILYLDYENSYEEALNYSRHLIELYPANPEYLALYIQNLLLVRKYDEAESVMKSTVADTMNSYFRAQTAVFNGILQEKKYYNYNRAETFYNTGIKEMSGFGYYGDEYAAYAYFGLSRINDVYDNKYYKKKYRRKANELAVLKKINFD